MTALNRHFSKMSERPLYTNGEISCFLPLLRFRDPFVHKELGAVFVDGLITLENNLCVGRGGFTF